MKKLYLLCLGTLLCLTGCTTPVKEDKTKPVLELNHTRVQVDLNSEIDYQSFITKANDDVDGDMMDMVTYNKIDTSLIGPQKIIYSVKDTAGNETTQILDVDVVHMYDGGIFSPLEVDAEVVDDAHDVTVLINKLHSLPKDWKPDDLQPVIDNGAQMLRKEANEAYTKFYNDAKSQGIDIYSISGYRTTALQTRYWNNMLKVYGEEYASQYSAYPDRSEHQLGLAIDVSYKTTGDRLSEKVADQEIGKFIANHGHEYGFILRYPRDKVAVTNYGYEPWHMRYVGVELATKLHNENITLEEYYKQ